MSPHAGWYLVAFTDELVADLTPVRIGARRLMLVRGEGADPYLVDSTCPHRGADLAYGGVLRGDTVTCPFHGRRIRLGESSHPFAVRRHPTLTVGPLVFARLADGPKGDCGFPDLVSGLLAGRTVVPAVATDVQVPVHYVVENAFDAEHFSVVHGVPAVQGMRARTHPAGYLTIAGEFMTVHDPWQDEALRDYLRFTLGPECRRVAHTSSGFHATAFSPTLVVTVFGSGEDAAVILTGAVPTPEGSRVRVAVAGGPGTATQRVVEGAVKAIEQDVQVWSHLDPDAPTCLDELDAPVIAFQDFCRRFPTAPHWTPIGVGGGEAARCAAELPAQVGSSAG